jgi:GNAT superfamily N-acetyltransferase
MQTRSYLRARQHGIKAPVSRDMEIKLIQHGSPEYDQMVRLRIHTLLDPINIPSTFIVPEHETKDVLIGVFKDQDMVACCILTEKDGKTVQLRQMAVHPEQQRSGIGAALLSFAERKALESGYELLMMHARAAVRGFYEKCGYEAMGPRFYEVGIPHYVMQKAM